ncbi:MAG: peptidylprolyl isomerase [Bacteroidota bacterium]|nr:peptidylprolyl isomerase [Bacteroidota bacterium]
MNNIRFFVFTMLLVMLAALSATAQTGDATTDKEETSVEKEIAVIETNHGTIEIEFFREDAPKTVENFVQLAKKGYFDGVTFHRVISGFMIQGGDPTGSGSGGESIYGKSFDDEIDADSPLYETGYKRGIMAMANRGPNTNSSQFFIMHKDYNLPPSYTIFARVISGMDTVDKIAAVPTDSRDRPKSDVVMNKVTIK